MECFTRISCLLLVGYLLNAGSVVGGPDTEEEDMVIYVGEGMNGIYNQPYFDNSMKTNFTVQVGHSLEMPCIVRQIGSKTVSWIRKHDGAILSVDDMLVKYDERIEIEKKSYLSQWNLKIKGTVPGDEGQYECQVSTEKKLSQVVNLQVTVPSLTIEGSPSILASAGSNISLRCSVRGETHKTPISWFFEEHDGTITLLEEKKNSVVRIGPGSMLLVKVGPHSAGNYSCSSHKSNSATVSINVVDGELTPEAMLEEDMKLLSSDQLSLTAATDVLLLSLFSLLLSLYFYKLL